MTSTLRSIEQLALKLAEKAAKDAVSITEMTEAAKVLAPYYTALKKAEAKGDDDSDDGTTMSGLQEALRAASESDDGRTVSRSARRRN